MGRSITRAFFLLISFTAIVLGAEARGQTPVPPAKPVYGKAFFRNRLDALSKRYRVGFVIEGEPHVVTLSRIKEFQDRPQEGCEDAVQRLAGIFDYSARRRGTLYLLRKKYTYPQEMPNVAPGECRQAAAAIRSLLQPLSNLKTEPGWNGVNEARDAMQGIRGGMTSEQVDRLNQGGVVRFADFTPAQRQSAQRLLMHTYVISMTLQAGIVEAELNDKRQVRFTRDSRGNFGYSAERGEPAPSFRLIARPRVSVGSASGTTVHESGMRLPVLTEPPISQPIQEVVARLNARRRSTTNGGTLVVDHELAQKPITLIGDEAAAASPAKVAAAIAEVYGLRVRNVTTRLNGASQAPQSRIITRVPVRMENLQDSMAAVRRCLPLPLITALHLADIDEILDKDERNNARSNASDRAFLQAVRKAKDAQGELLNEAVWQLVDAGERELDKANRQLPVGAAKPAAIPLLALDSPTQASFAVFVMRELLSEVCFRSRPPVYVSHFDDLGLGFRRSIEPDGTKKITISFLYTDPRTGATVPILSFDGQE